MRCHPVEIVVFLVLGLFCALGPADAQRPAHVPRLGYLGLDAVVQAQRVAAFLDGLRALGYVDGQNIAIEYRWAEGRFERLPELSAELVRLPVDILVIAGGPPAVRAAQQATRTIPIVVAVMHEPVVMGFVASLARPGGNITGQAFQDSELSTKRLELLKEVAPQISRLAVLWDPAGGGATALHATEEAARALGLELQILEVRGPHDFERAFEAAKTGRAQALMQLASPLFLSHSKTMIDLLAKSRLPATCASRAFVVEGCLMAYGPSFDDMHRRAAYYVERILLLAPRQARNLGIG